MMYLRTFNNIMFDGDRVLDDEELESIPTEAFTRKAGGGLRQGNRDIRKADKRNRQYRLLYGLENQQKCYAGFPRGV